VIPVGRARRVARLVEDDTGTPSGPSAAQSLRTMEKR